MCRAPSPNRRRSLSASMAASTRSRLSSGSPIPMNTMLVSRWPSAVEAPRREADLVDDLGDLEVAPEPELAGRAERAADGAAGLARDAQRVALARAGPRRVVHQHRFDERAVGQPVERLLGQAAVGFRELGLGDGVEAERGLELGAQRRPAASASRRSSRSCRPTRHRRPGGRGRRARSRSASHAASASGVSPDNPGRCVRGHRSMLPQGGQTVGRTSLPTIARPAAQVLDPRHPPAAGRLDLVEHERAVAGRRARARSKRPDGRCSLGGRDSAAQTVSRPLRRLDERARPRLDRRGPGARARRRAATGRAARPRGAAAASASRRPSAAGARGSRRGATAPAMRSSRSAPIAASRASSSGAVSSGAIGRPGLGDDRAGVEALVHPHQRDAGLAVAGQDRRRDRGRAAVARQQRRMEVERAVPRARAGPAGRSGRSRRGRPAPGSSARIVGDRRRRRAAASGVRIVRDARARAASFAIGVVDAMPASARRDAAAP